MPTSLLHRVELEGVYHDPDDAEKTPLFEWAQVLHVLCQTWFGLIPVADPALLRDLTVEVRNRYYSGGLFSPLASGTMLTRRSAVQVSTGVGVDVEEDFELQDFDDIPCCAPQTSLLVYGRSAVLGSQTRKWVPCLRRDALQEKVGRTQLNGGPMSPSLRDWSRLLLSPANNPPIAPVTPVIYDPDADAVRTITEILVADWPRTQRRRTNDAVDEHTVVATP